MLQFQYNIVELLVFAICINVTVPLECFNCFNTSNVNTCAVTTTCQSGQSCYLEFSNSDGYRLGCVEHQKCGSPSNVSASIVGRNLLVDQEHTFGDKKEYTERDIREQETQHCFECCSFDICNKHLCDHLKPTSCIDDSKIDCAWLNSRFNICQSIHDAKYVCPKFCGLCSLVDGNWGQWSFWSMCDVTCENGTQTRVRQCNNPTPVYGGLTCFGNATEEKSCHLQTCPIDGNWNYWSPWSACNVTCNNGTRTRTRMCNNPAPEFNGHNCLGNSVEYKMCINDFCPIHGGWTQWLEWEPCSATCDIGIKRRHRNCTNPLPDHYGHYCFGDPMDVAICLPEACANGGWSIWSEWSSCNDSLYVDIVTRTRTCTNPRPSALGRPCEGDAIQGSLCGNITRPNVSAFSVDQPITVGGKFTFSHIIYQQGTDFNISTGIFTCSIPGTYLFSVNLVKKKTSGRVYDTVGCTLTKNAATLALLSLDPTDDVSSDSGSTGVSSTVVISLSRGDTVSLNGCSVPASMEPTTDFTGVLLFPLV